MPTYASTRGIKNAEVFHYVRGTNKLATVTWTAGVGGGVNTVIHPDFVPRYATIHRLLTGAINVHRLTPLLWTYAVTANQAEVVFGHDMHLHGGTHPGAKIGHAALTAAATIAGEIAPEGGRRWLISNESGAWGSMGGNGGKTAMLTDVARFMTLQTDMTVRSRKAYSRNAAKRLIQKAFR